MLFLVCAAAVRDLLGPTVLNNGVINPLTKAEQLPTESQEDSQVRCYAIC